MGKGEEVATSLGQLAHNIRPLMLQLQAAGLLPDQKQIAKKQEQQQQQVSVWTKHTYREHHTTQIQTQNTTQINKHTDRHQYTTHKTANDTHTHTQETPPAISVVRFSTHFLLILLLCCLCAVL